MANMYLTSNELSAISSIVAALAIIGGYLGVKSANQNSLKLAGQERDSRKSEDSKQLKRETYARFLTAVLQLRNTGQNESKQLEVLAQATNEMGLVSLIAPTRVQHHVVQMLNALADVDEVEEAEEAEEVEEAEAEKAQKVKEKFNTEFAKLMLVMRWGLEGKELPTEEKIERIVKEASSVDLLDGQDGRIEADHRGS